jgi:hypothetical protein
MAIPTSFLKTTGATLANAPACPKLASFLRPTLPDEDGLVGLYVFGGSREGSMRNLVVGAPPLTLIGGPTVGLGMGANCNRDNGFDTGLLETAGFTFLVGCRIGGNGNPFIAVGNYGSAPKGAALYVSDTDATTVAGTSASNDNTNQAGVNLATPASATDWYSFCGRGDASQVTTSVRYKGVITRTDGFQNGHVLSARTLRIGAHYGTGFTRFGDVLFAAIFNKKLTAAAGDAAQVAIAQFFADTAGITTL